MQTAGGVAMLSPWLGCWLQVAHELHNDWTSTFDILQSAPNKLGTKRGFMSNNVFECFTCIMEGLWYCAMWCHWLRWKVRWCENAGPLWFSIKWHDVTVNATRGGKKSYSNCSALKCPGTKLWSQPETAPAKSVAAWFNCCPITCRGFWCLTIGFAWPQLHHKLPILIQKPTARGLNSCLLHVPTLYVHSQSFTWAGSLC